jgi:hypothetical protein
MLELDRTNYFSAEANREYMSVSQYKSFKKCEAAALAEINGEYQKPKTEALLIGSFVDACFEGTEAQFTFEHPDMFNGRTGELKAPFKKAYDVLQRLKRDEVWMHYATGGKEQVIMTGEISGVPFKIAIDNLHPDMIVDRKIMKDFEPIYVPEQGRLPWYEAWGYDTQGAAYREVCRQNTGEVLPFILAAGTKEDEPDLTLLEIDSETLDFELSELEKNAPRYDAIKKGIIPAERCEKCAYCRRTKVITSPINTKEIFDE